jgi:hypothetical protein
MNENVIYYSAKTCCSKVMADSDQSPTSFASLLLPVGDNSSRIAPAKDDPMATANAIGTTVLLCTLALAVGAGCLFVFQARSKYRKYALSSMHRDRDEEGEDNAPPVIISLYPAFPQYQQENVEKTCPRCSASPLDDAEESPGETPVFTIEE